MIIEIHTAQLERRVRDEIQNGRFHDADELLTKALDALEKQETGLVDALLSPPFAHSELYIPRRQKDSPSNVDL